MLAKITNVCNTSKGEINGHNGENYTRIPLIFFDIPADKGARQSKESDHKPVGIVTKKTPAHATKWDLNKIDERLRNKKKDKGLKCRFEWFFTVNDNKDSWEDPPFGRNGDIMERITIWY